MLVIAQAGIGLFYIKKLNGKLNAKYMELESINNTANALEQYLSLLTHSNKHVMKGNLSTLFNVPSSKVCVVVFYSCFGCAYNSRVGYLKGEIERLGLNVVFLQYDISENGKLFKEACRRLNISISFVNPVIFIFKGDYCFVAENWEPRNWMIMEIQVLNSLGSD